MSLPMKIYTFLPCLSVKANCNEKCKFPLFKSREYIRIYVHSVYNHILHGVTSILMHHYTLDAIIN